MPTFSGPVVYDVPRVLPDTRGVARLVMRHYSPGARGRTVVKVAGVYSTVDNPTQALLDTATEVYLGGHVYVITDAVAAALQTAGYTVEGSPTHAWSFYAGSTWGSLENTLWGAL